MTKRSAIKRDIFAELVEGFDALGKQRQGKITLRTFKVQSKPAPNFSPQDVLSVREHLHLSRPYSPAICAPIRSRYRNGNKTALNPTLKPPC